MQTWEVCKNHGIGTTDKYNEQHSEIQVYDECGYECPKRYGYMCIKDFTNIGSCDECFKAHSSRQILSK